MLQAAPAQPIPALAGARTGHVIVISIDGLSPGAISHAGAETLLYLRREGAHARMARTIVPSLTLPSHTSMLTGVGVETHGITWNTDRTDLLGVVAVPTMFELAHDAGLETAAVVGKRKLKHLFRPGSLDYVVYPRTDVYLLADQVAERAIQYLTFERPNLLFIHIPDPDLAGHIFGWDEWTYRRGVRRADAAVAYIQTAARRAFGDNYVLIVTADHGGKGHSHGSADEPHVRIPWIAWGEDVAPGIVEEEIQTFDTAATALWLLGVPVPEGWDGEPVREAFVSEAR